jgi:hypothetical protein
MVVASTIVVEMRRRVMRRRRRRRVVGIVVVLIEADMLRWTTIIKTLVLLMVVTTTIVMWRAAAVVKICAAIVIATLIVTTIKIATFVIATIIVTTLKVTTTVVIVATVVSTIIATIIIATTTATKVVVVVVVVIILTTIIAASTIKAHAVGTTESTARVAARLNTTVGIEITLEIRTNLLEMHKVTLRTTTALTLFLELLANALPKVGDGRELGLKRPTGKETTLNSSHSSSGLFLVLELDVGVAGQMDAGILAHDHVDDTTMFVHFAENVVVKVFKVIRWIFTRLKNLP